ncbi:MAG: hypothetical protein NVS1B11_33940 [Terriglobales bacterium]
MKKYFALAFLLLSLAGVPRLFAIEDLKLNSNLDYGSDSLDGALISGSDAQSGFVAGKPNYVIIYGEGCFNSKRQARRTVELYNKYRSQVHFVVVDLDIHRSPEQQQLVKQYYKGSIPHVLVLDAQGSPVYDRAGEVESRVIEDIFQKSLSRNSLEQKPNGETRENASPSGQ